MVRIFETELIKEVFSYDVILVGMGINNSFSEGFAYDVALNFPDVKKRENSISGYGDKRNYGKVLQIPDSGITFCMCYMHTGGYRKNDGEFVDYTALKNCLNYIADRMSGKRIASPLLGSSKFDGNGERGRLLKLYEEAFSDCDIDLYLYEQDTFDDRMYKKILELRKKNSLGEIGKEEFNSQYNRLMWMRKNGIFKEMPEDYRPGKKRFSWDNVITVKKTDLDK